ncbi:DUF2163 domain-containing protein [Nitratireductor kimnyeongensis]|uniref:DUF2163 domain-containing protein n=1 Tax=Nitratireductor kimnyeongensis TaxID=430679 RepID=A0ABW0T4X3_9HYPH|nr:DUF2163 domain-containing protein [Nitratireductor kimnyeongensis]QZZ34586.1 DUF2163 domain-containing protein [Nitratireductor kimnyeongensis]
MALPTVVQDLLDEGRIAIRGLMKFQFGTGTYGFAKSDQPIEWNGLTYQPGGIIKVSDLPGGTGTTARQFTIELAESPDDGLTPDVLKTIEAEDYRDRPVTIYDAFFHPDTGALLHVEALRRGYIDQLSHEEDPEEGYKLIADCETRALDYTRTNGRKRNMADQYRRVDGDNFYVNAALTGRQDIRWGRATSSPKRARGFGSIQGFIDDINKRLGI